MGDLGTFANRMRTRSGEVIKGTTQAKQTVARHVLTAVVHQTPIDTGRARFSWNVGMNAPNYGYEWESFDNYGRLGDWLGKMATSRAAILRATEKDSIYISNGLPYIGELNRGKSKQAPADYVRTAAIGASSAIAGVRILR